MSTGIFLSIDGQPVPIEECDWIQVAPCGCVCAVTVAASRGEVYAATPDQAKEQFADSKAMRERDDEDGFTVRVIKHSEFKAMDDFGRCSHTPKWGRPEAVVPEGHSWAVVNRPYGRRSSTKHLVPVEGDTSLCGATERHYLWVREGADRMGVLYDCVTCRKCEKAAGYEHVTSGRDMDPHWGEEPDEPGPWVDSSGVDRTPGADLDTRGGWL